MNPRKKRVKETTWILFHFLKFILSNANDLEGNTVSLFFSFDSIILFKQPQQQSPVTAGRHQTEVIDINNQSRGILSSYFAVPPRNRFRECRVSLNFCFPCTSFSSFGPLYPDVSCSCASLLSEGDTASGNLHAGRTATREVRKLDYHVLLIIFRGSDGAWWFALVPIPPPRHTWNDSGPTPDRWRPGFIHQALTHCGTDNSILQKVSCF